MTGVQKKLSETARTALSAAKTRPDHLVRLPRLPIAAARQVARSLLNGGLVEEVQAQIEHNIYAWRTSEVGVALTLRATALGLARVDEADAALEGPTAGQPAETDREAPGQSRQLANDAEATTVIPGAAKAATETTAGLITTPTSGRTSDGAVSGPQTSTQTRLRGTLRHAAQALLEAWDDPTSHESGNIDALDGAFATLRAALAGHTKTTSDKSQPSKDTKQVRVLAMLRRPEGASGPDIAAEMSWAPHTVRGFLAALSKKGVIVEVLERVRQVGPDNAGAKGSYTVYHVSKAQTDRENSNCRNERPASY